ncbi:tyrosine protein kinase [Pedobacter sp. HMWF019]|uniref:GumC family protein n=1 Tax=Pedobacter sp. HMWF019 TaxID=2056856 RepID=UPI000D3BBC94|nr:tyrosine-protein kinase family protein [Pedobacter sp. HMWF019]PTT02321.1 tyrosine protein kinase [Pedobacter sp. HMWF019]
MKHHIQSPQKLKATDDNADLKKLFHDLLRIWPAVVVLILVNLCIAYLLTRRANPTYQTQATLEIKEDKNQASVELFQTMGLKTTPSSIENEIAILSSFTLAHNALSELDYRVEYFKKDLWKKYEVYHGLPYEVEVDWGHPQLIDGEMKVKFLEEGKFRLSFEGSVLNLYNPRKTDTKSPVDLSKLQIEGNYRLNTWIEGKHYKFRVVKTASVTETGPDFSFVLKSDYDLAEYYSKVMKVEVMKKESSVLSLTLESHMVEKDKIYLNKIMQVYQHRELKEKNQTSINTSAFINDQLKNITDSLVFFEDKLQKYRTKNETFNLEEQGSLVYTRLSTLEDNNAGVSLKIKYYESTLNYLEEGKVNQLVVPSSIGIEEAVLEKLIPELVEVQSSRLRLREVLSKDNRALKELDFKYTSILNSLRENLNRSLQIAKLSFREMNKRISALTGELDQLPQVERNLLSIKRQFTISENIYLYLLQKRSEAEITKASNTPSSEVLDLSRQIGNMLSPKPVRNYIIAFCLGILLPVLFLFIRNMTGNRIYDVKLLESKLVVPLIGIIGRSLWRENNNVVSNSPKSFVSENFRSVRVSTQFLHPPDESIVIAFTSSKSGEGKTFCSVNMAGIYALSGKKTILVGMDLRRPKIASDFGLLNDVGVSTYLSTKKELSQLIKPSGSENLDILLSGTVPPNPAELIGKPRFQEMIQILKSTYDVVILDCPPAALVSETIDIFNLADLNFYIFRHLYSDWEAVENMNDLVEKGLIKKTYAIYNDTEMPSSYGYGYEYHFEEQENNRWKKFLKLFNKHA